MKDFLAYVAEDMINKYDTNLSDIAVVFPNKRASLFLNEHLARYAKKPVWSPHYITISELFRQQSQLMVADPLKLVCDLHKSFCKCTRSQESLDKFFGWGQLLLSDFDDIDKNMADADHVFANLRDIHELDDISYLTEEQRDMIRRFFSNFSEDHNTELKERFLRLWSHFADIYHDFNDRLSHQGLTYEGALYRQVVEQQEGQYPHSHYLFVGFNLLQKVEQQLFNHLMKNGKARFYWDFDHYYMEGHEAGQYIGQYLKYFPNELDVDADEIYGNFNHAKRIHYISAPTENIQARYVSNWLREEIQHADGTTATRFQDGRKTAIVLCNEALLQVIIHSLPPEVDKVNITTGYPLEQTPVASFIQLWFNLQLGGHTPRLLRALQRHPYVQYIDLPAALDTPADTSITTQLLNLLRQIATNAKDTVTDPLYQESLFRAYTLLNRLQSLISSGDLVVDDITLQRLTSQLIQQTTIPFHGEPAEGVQVMGVLETRNLDFDHVILLSCNEGNMPKGVNDSSFIPHNIRRAYELTTVDNKVAIYAYYFHRLIQRAKDITILFNSSTEDGQRGEMSRFMLQMLVESPHSIERHLLQSGQSVAGWQPRDIEKDDRIMKILNYSFSSSDNRLSPTAICKYMRCQLQFYYRYVAGIKEPEVPDDEQDLDNRIFGTIFHEAADIIYHQLPQQINKEILDHLLKSKVEIERAVDEAFHRVIPHIPPNGLHLINREVIIHYLRQLISIDRRLAPFTILGLECNINRKLEHHDVVIGGRIDRLDLINIGTPDECIRVIDYKTGSRRLKPLADVDAIFQPENIHNHADYYLQTFVYADIISRQQPSKRKVSPALLFIQHSGGEDYDPTLYFGQERINDIANYSMRFNELLEQVVSEIFSKDNPFRPTNDMKVCQTCPYAQLCRH
jgi:CRISPR/Cas system-associated exonuclease Cas4 (RecB family)